MPFTLDVIFTGLCVAVHDTTHQRLDVLVMDASSNAHQNEGMRPHTPFLVADIEDRGLVSNGFTKVGKPKLTATGSLVQRYTPPRKRFVFHGASNALDLEDTHSAALEAANAKLPTSGQESDIYWLLRLAKLGGGFAQVKAEHMSPSSKVHSIYSFTHGVAGCYSLAMDSKSSTSPVVAWDFAKEAIGSPVVHTQAMADRLRVHLEVSGAEVDIRSEDSMEGFKIIPPKWKTTTTIVIGNVDNDLAERENEKIRDFRWFYELVDMPPALSDRPIPKASASPPSGSGVVCPIIRMEAP